MNCYRTHTCGELTKEHVGQNVMIAGWVDTVRDHGGVIFIDLRDNYGLTQIVIDPERDFYQALDKWRVESVVQFDGVVVERSAETVNPKLATGEIEVAATGMEMLGEAEVLPFQVAKFRAKTNQLCTFLGAKAFSGAQVGHRFQKICLSLSVITYDQVHARIKI